MTGREVIASHTNSEGERITIERITADGHEFSGQLVLVIHDDPPLFSQAPMLLDDETQEWLANALYSLRESTDAPS